MMRATFEEALRQWRELDKDQPSMRFPYNPKMYAGQNVHDDAHLRGVRHCEGCGAPIGNPGFVRFDFPVGHPLFGQAFPCPRCNGGRARNKVGWIAAAVVGLFA